MNNNKNSNNNNNNNNNDSSINKRLINQSTISNQGIPQLSQPPNENQHILKTRDFFDDLPSARVVNDIQTQITLNRRGVRNAKSSSGTNARRDLRNINRNEVIASNGSLNVQATMPMARK